MLQSRVPITIAAPPSHGLYWSVLLLGIWALLMGTLAVTLLFHPQLKICSDCCLKLYTSFITALRTIRITISTNLKTAVFPD